MGSPFRRRRVAAGSAEDSAAAQPDDKTSPPPPEHQTQEVALPASPNGHTMQPTVSPSSPSRLMSKLNSSWAQVSALQNAPRASDLKCENGDSDLTEKGLAPLYELFVWLGWSPAASLPDGATLLRVFPGALPAPAMHRRIAVVLDSLGLKPENTIFGHSTCPDEINNQPGHLTPLMGRHWGDSFPLGGIGGAPFVGKTGFAAFSHHVPDNGHVLILYGPHIAISSNGKLGEYIRHGQSCSSSACGAVLAAYKQCCACVDDYDGAPEASPSLCDDDEDDMQQAWLRAKIGPRVRKIQQAEEPLGELAHAAYQAIRVQMRRIVNTDFGPGKLVLIGGIQINMPEPGEDHFLPLSFTIEDAQSPPQDLLHRIAIV